MKSVLLKNTFNDVVDVYDKARPTYPQELLDDVMKFANRNFFESGLEVGAGTGQATDLFLNRIKKLDIVEVGDKQVEYLNEKYSNKNISVYKAYFEDYSSKEKYDLIYSATAFHWVDDTIGYPKAWNMLKDGGVMAVFWHMSSVTYRDYGIFVGLDKIKRKYLPNESLGFDDEGIEGVRKKRIEQHEAALGPLFACFCYLFLRIILSRGYSYVLFKHTYKICIILKPAKHCSIGHISP